MTEWIRPGINMDFIGRARLWYGVSAVAVTLSLLLLPVNMFARGSVLNYGNDFKGGSEIQVEFARGVDPAAVRAALDRHGYRGAEVVRIQDARRPHLYVLRLGEVSAYSEKQIDQAKKALAERFKDEQLKRLDFSEGGDKIFVRFAKPVAPEALHEALRAAGLSPQNIEAFGRPEDNTSQVTLVGLDHEVRRAFEKEMGAGVVKDIPQVESVGAKVGAQLRADGIKSVAYTLILMLFYIALRFNFQFAPGAVVALAHDVLIVVGLFALMWKEFTLQTVAALLTVGGYSINDTIVVFDRIRENTARMRDRRLDQLVNASINETLPRTTLTALTTIFTTMAVWYFVRGPVRDFALAMTVGIAVGTYSSIFIASPLYVWLHERVARRARPA
jgi:preprotein translocase subunit SecF